MRTLRSITEDEMVAVFLRAELDSPRFGQRLRQLLCRDGIAENMVRQPDLHDAAANRRRRDLLAEFRGYGRNSELFHNFPDEIAWERVVLERGDLQGIEYIDYPYWFELAGGSRRARDAARRITAGVLPREQVAGYWTLADLVRQGRAFPELILVGKSPRDDLVVLEGHARVTAYLMAAAYLPPELEAIVGYSAAIERRDLYGDPGAAEG